MDRRQFFLPHRRPDRRTAPPSTQIIEQTPEVWQRLLASRTAAPPVSGLAPYAGPWTKDEAIHLLRRLSFGPTKAEIDFVLTLSAGQTVDALLNAPYTDPAPPVNDYNGADFTDPVVAFGDTWVNAPFTEVDAEFYRMESLRGWWMRLMMTGRFREKMTLFWHNHLPVQFFETILAGNLYRYVKTLRDNALGNFKTLVKAITLDPAMLYYLSGYANSADAPDENYAREIQELFVIGKDLPSYYTEGDVKAAARLLTGWRITPYATFYNALEHDPTDKQFSAFYNNRTITGQSGLGGGMAELDEFLDMLFDHPEAARFICRKIYRFFVYHDIDPTTEQNIILPLAQLLRDNNYDVLPVLSVLFKSEHFFDVLNRGAMIKSPVDMAIGLFRQFGITLPGSADLYDTFAICYQLNYALFEMLQFTGDPPNVAGWQAYYQAPVFDKIWINTATLPKRGLFTQGMVYTGIFGFNSVAIINPLAWALTLTDPADPVALIDEAFMLLFGLPVSQQVRDYFLTILLSDLPTPAYWTGAWQYWLANPTDPVATGIVLTRLRSFLWSALQMEEYQLM